MSESIGEIDPNGLSTARYALRRVEELEGRVASLQHADHGFPVEIKLLKQRIRELETTTAALKSLAEKAPCSYIGNP